MPKALFVEIQAKAGSEDAIEQFLRQAVAAAEAEPDTRDWFALRFDADHFALFDTFDGNLGRLKHLAGEIGRGLVMRSFNSLSGLPEITSGELVAAKLPTGTAVPTHALCVPIQTRLGQGRDFGEWLLEARALVGREQDTLGWYALRTGPNHYVMIDVFPSAEARQTHLDGMATSGLAEQVGRYLEAMPEIRHAEVLASKQSGWRHVASTEQKVHPEQSVRIGPEAS